MAALLKQIARTEPPPPWGLFGAINTIFITLLAIFAATALMLSLTTDQAIALMAAWLIGQVLAAVYVLMSRREGAAHAALRIGPTPTRLFIVLLLSLGLAMVFDLLALGATGLFLPAMELSGLHDAGLTVVGWLLALVFMLVVQPVAEELVFRGVVMPSLRTVTGPWIGLIVTAAFYMLFHFMVYSSPISDPWYALAAPLLAGLYFGMVRAATGSTRAAIVAHMGFGLFALVKLLVI